MTQPIGVAQPSPEMESLDGYIELGKSDITEELDVGPDAVDEPACEGTVNVPVPTRNQERLGDKTEESRGNDDVPSSADAVIADGVTPRPIGMDREPVLRAANAQVMLGTQMSHPLLREGMLQSEATDMSSGLDGMMNDLSELIDLMPMDQAVEDHFPALFRGTFQSNPLHHLSSGNHMSPEVTPYDPSERPTSRWRCRWRLFTPHEEGEEQSYSSGAARYRNGDAFTERMDNRNPYIKALKTTRQELHKSWDLMAEASPATRLATERQDALTTLVSTPSIEVEQFQADSRLSCMPEPCRQTCRETAHEQYACEVRIRQTEFSHILQRHNRFDADAGMNPKNGRGQPGDVLSIDSDMHRAGMSEDFYMTGDIPTFKYQREEV